MISHFTALAQLHNYLNQGYLPEVRFLHSNPRQQKTHQP
ncbi:hypothetical protein BN135_3810 [Cronobacter muytjensii 530]